MQQPLHLSHWKGKDHASGRGSKATIKLSNQLSIKI